MASEGEFLAAVPIKIRKLLERQLTEAVLERGATICPPYSKLDTAYFPVDCVLSVSLEIRGGVTFCTGVIGSDGLLSAGLCLDDRICTYGVSVLSGGHAFAIPMTRLRDVLMETPKLRKRALSYDQFLLAQAQQNAACGTLHEAMAKLATWLLRLRHYVGDEIRLTQGALSQMLGVRRTTVTEAALGLQRAGAIAYQRGSISIVNAKTLKHRSCRCHEETRAHYDRLRALAEIKCSMRPGWFRLRSTFSRPLACRADVLSSVAKSARTY